MAISLSKESYSFIDSPADVKEPISVELWREGEVQESLPREKNKWLAI